MNDGTIPYKPLTDSTAVTSTTTLLASMVLILLVGAFLSLLFAHIAGRREVNPISEAVSDYGVGELRWFYRIAALWLGLAGLLTAAMLGDAMFPKPTLVILLLILFAATRWAITIFPTDLEGEEATSIGRSHIVLAVVAFGSISLAAVIFSTLLGDDRFWDEELGLMTAIGWTMMVLAIASGVTRRFLPQIFGLVERLLYLAMFAWLGAIAVIMLAAA
jgi:hypothetical protein